MWSSMKITLLYFKKGRDNQIISLQQQIQALNNELKSMKNEMKQKDNGIAQLKSQLEFQCLGKYTMKLSKIRFDCFVIYKLPI